MDAFSQLWNLHIILVIFIILIHTTSNASGSKYSKKANKIREDDYYMENEENPFRIKKVNLVWTKARKVLSGEMLAELYAELKTLDRDMGELKRLKSIDADKDGRKDAAVSASLKYILHHYKLDDFYRGSDNEIPFGDETKSVIFEDRKLQSMWKRAEVAGFSEKDLEMLKEEFWHQQMKLNELDFMERQLNAAEGEKDIDIDVKWTKEEKHENMANLKKQSKQVRDGYNRLEELSSSLPQIEIDFKDYRVQKLWALAKKTNWSEEEKDDFKEELKHFEHRLSKQDYYQEQLDLTEEAYKNKFRDEGVYPEKVHKMREKTDEIKQKVQKLHSHMRTKIDKALRHSEL